MEEAEPSRTLEVDSAEPVRAAEDASTYCPVCFERLEARSCKLICASCGYYMSCSDYY